MKTTTYGTIFGSFQEVSIRALDGKGPKDDLLCYGMRIQPHVLAVRIIVDIVIASPDEFGINGHGGVGCGFDIAANHGLLQFA